MSGMDPPGLFAIMKLLALKPVFVQLQESVKEKSQTC